MAITRCGNLFGGGDLNWTRLVPGTIRSVLRDSPPLIRSNGRLIRDYVYVEDAVDAYLAVADALVDSDVVAGQAVNISYGEPQSVIGLVRRILARMGRSDTRGGWLRRDKVGDFGCRARARRGRGRGRGRGRVRGRRLGASGQEHGGCHQ